jgi:hypothetical protein
MDCSGHGSCMSIASYAQSAAAVIPFISASTYKYSNQLSTSAWDDNTMWGCHCESSWVVGLGAGQVQATEYFGPLCDKHRCPTGDDPSTEDVDETNCENRRANGAIVDTTGASRGAYGNKCHVDCSNRGSCDYASGVCKCFLGYTGTNCGLLVSEGTKLRT